MRGLRRDRREVAAMPGVKSRGVTWSAATAVVAVGFGLLTIKEGGSVLFGSEAARAAVGQYVPFVLWFNFLAGFAYTVAGIGLWKRQPWAAWLSILVAAGTALTFAAFGAHVYAGGDYKRDTVVAMSARLLVWVFISSLSYHRLVRRPA